MAGDEAVKKITASDILKEVPPLGGFGEELTPLQKVGYKLALFVFFLMVGTIIVIFIVSFRSRLPAFPSPPITSSNPEQYKQLVDEYKTAADVYQLMAKAQVERAIQLFQLVVASTMLPAFTAILGYIFGSRRSE